MACCKPQIYFFNKNKEPHSLKRIKNKVHSINEHFLKLPILIGCLGNSIIYRRFLLVLCYCVRLSMRFFLFHLNCVCAFNYCHEMVLSLHFYYSPVICNVFLRTSALMRDTPRLKLASTPTLTTLPHCVLASDSF